MTTCRLIIDPPASGAWNMAVDEMLLQQALANGRPTLRLYQWNPATLSLGYFQRVAERGEHAASQSCPVVRRSSGGGAILHDCELTYSLAIPVADARRAPFFYGAVHQALIEALAEFNVSAVRAPKCPAVPAFEQPFLCFQRRACEDVLVKDAKIAGSAQRRHRGGLLQHGSVLLATSTFAPELPGLAELSAGRLGADQLASAWLPRLAETLQMAWTEDVLSTAERASAGEIEAEKYGCNDWNGRR